MPEEKTSRWAPLLGLWASASGVGAFVLHAAGYLALRHHLTALGIETDLAVVDERYLFAGLRFFLYLCLSLPHLLLLLAVPALAALAVWGLAKAVRVIARKLGGKKARGKKTSAGSVFSPAHWPKTSAVAGIVLAVLAIQLVMRQVFLFDRLLLRPALPRPEWLARVLLDDALGLRQTFYFAALGLGIAVTAALLAAARRGGAPTGLCVLLGMLVLIQGMLLPITHGSLTAGREVPRIAWPEAAGSPPGEAWLVWETKEDLVLLTRRGEQRRIVRIGKKKVERLEMLCADPLLRILHDGERSRCG